MNKNTMILVIGAAIAAYFFLSGKKTGTGAAGGSKPGGTNGTGTAGAFNAPKGTTTGNNSPFSDIGNYANQFANLTKTVSGLYDNYFGGSSANPGYNDPTALDNVDVTDYTDTPDAAYLGG